MNRAQKIMLLSVSDPELDRTPVEVDSTLQGPQSTVLHPFLVKVLLSITLLKLRLISAQVRATDSWTHTLSSYSIASKRTTATTLNRTASIAFIINSKQLSVYFTTPHKLLHVSWHSQFPLTQVDSEEQVPQL